MQHASEVLVTRKPDIFQRPIETRDRPLVHLLMWPVAAVNPDDRGLITIPVRVVRWPTECLRPVSGKALGMLGMITMAERMANHFVLQDPSVPRVGQLQQPVATTYGFKDRLHSSFGIHGRSHVNAHTAPPNLGDEPRAARVRDLDVAWRLTQLVGCSGLSGGVNVNDFSRRGWLWDGLTGFFQSLDMKLNGITDERERLLACLVRGHASRKIRDVGAE